MRKKVQSQDIKTVHVSSKFQLADLLTKALGRDHFQFLNGKLGIVSSYTPTGRGVLKIRLLLGPQVKLY